MSLPGFGGPGTVLQQLNAGLAARTALDTQFQLNLFNRILELLRELENCPAAVAALPSGTASALSITQAELTDFINRLSTPNNMDAHAVEEIVEPIARIGRQGDRSLRRTRGAVIGGPLGAIPRLPRARSGSSGSPGSGPSSPGSYRPPGSPSPSTGWSLSSYLPSFGRASPRSDGSSGSAGLARSGTMGSAIASSNPEVDDYLPPSATHTLRPLDNESSPFGSSPIGMSSLYGGPSTRIGNSVLGGRRTRRTKKYRNRR